jgi:isocitrate/isopropylmalate dehydrogenase
VTGEVAYTDRRRLAIGVIPGDGIGPELMDSAMEVMSAAAGRTDLDLDFTMEQGGAACYLEYGAPLAPGVLDRIRTEYAAVIKGPVGLPQVRLPSGVEAGLLGGVLRGGLDLFANVRPIRLMAGVSTPTSYQPGDVDYVIVRENTEGLYLSRNLGVGNDRAVSDQLLMTREGVERVVRYAFELAERRHGAPSDAVRRVTCVDKSNVLRSYAFFRRIFTEVAAEFPGIEADYRYADAAAHDLVASPGHFDVLVMENFLGDILSDLGAATVGGLGMCASGNIGAAAAYFEPIHGSAPSLAGLDHANPTSQILSGAMLLDHVGQHKAAFLVRDAVEQSFAAGDIELNAGQPTGGTRSVTRSIVTRIDQS